MNAGRELDVLVLEKVLGWQRYKAIRYGKPCVVIVPVYQNCWNFTRSQSDPGTWNATTDAVTQFERLPRPSTDIAAAWLVVERLDNWFVRIAREPGVWHARFAPYESTAEYVYALASTAPLAICLAALKACEVQP